MPTVILLDVSLSMAQSANPPARSSFLNGSLHDKSSEAAGLSVDSEADPHDAVTKKALAVHAVYKFLDELSHHAKLEYVCLVIFSSLWEIKVPFTREYEQIKSAVDSLSLYDKTCIDEAFAAAVTAMQTTWGTSMACQVLLVTDGVIDVTPEVHEKITHTILPFPCDFHALCVSSSNSFCCNRKLNSFKKLINEIGGTVSVPDGAATFSSVDEAVTKHIQQTYQVYSGILHCGNLSSRVQLHPPPTPTLREDDFTSEELQFSHQLSVIGFISQADIRSPACISRHLVLPLRESMELGDDDKADDGKAPSFIVLMHGAFKVEPYVALVKIREDWYAMLHSTADSRKKSNLILSVFKPGLDSVPWLGDLSMLSCVPTQTEPLPGVVVQQALSLPVQVPGKKSYANMSPSWLRQATLQSDIQKLLRYGRKLPDKLNIFYKELNRIHKSAVSIGFYQLLTGLAQILERECTSLPSTAHPEAAMQLQHAASLLSKKEVLNIHYIIQPLPTRFTSSSP